MDVERMCQLLPEIPRAGMADRFLRCKSEGDLGGEFLLFHRESITIEPDIKALMSPEDWAQHSKETRHRWGAVCSCTACGEDFIAGYVNNTMLRGIAFGQGPDGQLYDGYPYDEESEWDMVIECPEGETIQCPLCGSYVQILRRSDLKSGRTYQLAVCSVENIEQYTALITWFVRRRIDEMGIWREDIRPREALIIDEKWNLRLFAHTRGGGFYGESDLPEWEYHGGFHDGFQKRYHNYDSINHHLVGGKCWGDIPDLSGTTGEKTGIKEYIENGGDWPHMYLKLWRKHRNVENLMKAGWHRMIIQKIDRGRKTAFAYGTTDDRTDEFPWIRWNEVKPHKMLGLTKEESKTLPNALCSPEIIAEWAKWRDGEKITATEFVKLGHWFNSVEPLKNIRVWHKQFGDEWELRAVLRYVRAHKELKPAEVVQYLADCRRMVRNAHPRRRKFTERELWPVNLRQKHDELMEQERVRNRKEAQKKYRDGFRKVLNQYGDLEWTDGELCIRLPRDNGELIQEGSVLRHCVSGYGSRHISGSDTIFFVRKYRRPERSYYTLDICMNGTPREIQLHGYGNEHHGKHKEHRHAIPNKVRAFVDRWKAEVLMPWYAQQQAEKRKNNQAKEKKSA